MRRCEWATSELARYDSRKIATLLKNPGIIRNRLNVAAAVRNAQSFLAVRREFGSFGAYLWGFVDGQGIQNRRRTLEEIPAKPAVSDALSKDLIKRDFNRLLKNHSWRLENHIGGISSNQESMGYKDLRTR